MRRPYIVQLQQELGRQLQGRHQPSLLKRPSWRLAPPTTARSTCRTTSTTWARAS
ncbi:hypothetical protein LP420_05420 [Massilia sp. B-10]|nr:hypothetical protein LP420_05420 [Massilia sp. B-10]